MGSQTQTPRKSIHDYISNLVNKSWEHGIPLTRDSLKRHLIIYISSKKQLECEYLNFSTTYIEKRQWQGLKHFYCEIVSVCQRNSPDWLEQALQGALRIHNLLLRLE